MSNNSSGTTETAYYHCPPVWVEADPFIGCQNPPVSTQREEVFKKSLASGIRVVVSRDGLFVFDFNDWLPRAEMPDLNFDDILDNSIPPITSKMVMQNPKFQRFMEVSQQEVANVYRRVEVMNAHLACLNTALQTCQKESWPILQFISAGEYLKVDRGQDEIRRLNLIASHSPYHAYIEKFRSTTDTPTECPTRQLVTIQTVEKSFEILDSIIKSPIPDSLKLVTMLLQSARAYRDHDFSGSIILSWTVLEKLISIIWDKMLKDNKEREEEGTKIDFIDSKREKKLKGSLYSASTRIEILSLLNRINKALYTELNKIRKVRNAWLHNLGQVESEDASHGLVTSLKLFSEISLVKISLNISHQTTF
ncbi:hypothetical protein ACTRXD_13675 [Nitrospira sp. T9]|uniref:hypothetical protein n=1 Tax=unclassified Nitrospira TaxID=2652172 RepID=UPI003F9537A8